MRGRLVEDRIEERICKIRVIDGVIANYYPQEELIRCKDCKFNKNDKWVDCPIKEFYGRTLDNYCSLAERKEE